jgi:hypothetical protein
MDDVRDRLVQFVSAQVELIQETAALKAKVAEAEDWKSRRAQYSLHQTAVGGFVLAYTAGEPKHFACLTCAESKKEVHPLQQGDEYTGTHSCAACKTHCATFKAKEVDCSGLASRVSRLAETSIRMQAIEWPVPLHRARRCRAAGASRRFVSGSFSRPRRPS